MVNSPFLWITHAGSASLGDTEGALIADVIAKSGPAIMTLPGAIASPGGVPIFVGGKVIGAAGVSGVTGDQDEQCSKAGIAGM